ncbi:hypothetical protein BJ742DRAFT_814619 [Cladochytrium replicatum]|nr:hypothetical protein BJ742DRAFT_814619 [Cladochytrium replicatum]
MGSIAFVFPLIVTVSLILLRQSVIDQTLQIFKPSCLGFKVVLCVEKVPSIPVIREQIQSKREYITAFSRLCVVARNK